MRCLSPSFCHYATLTTRLLIRVSVFVERWHRNTDIFHLPVSEMNIKLDDVSILFHLTIMRQFYSHVTLNFKTLLVDLLRMEFDDVTTKLRQCCGAHVRMSWLHEVYGECIVQQKGKYASQAYLFGAQYSW